jgi:DNA-binding NarL/FixJ family response regulator
MSLDLIRVVLADDHAVVRAGLRAVLGAAADITVVGEAKNGREAVEMAERLTPHVVVMDLTMPEMDGHQATREIVAKELGTRVLVLTMHTEADYLMPTLEAGAAGYLVKSAADRELVDAVRAVANGDMYMSPAAGHVLARSFQAKDPAKVERERYERLTERERDVLRLLAAGRSNDAIAAELYVSNKTVRNAVSGVYAKLHAAGRAEAIIKAREAGYGRD